MINLFIIALPVAITVNLLLGLIVLLTHARRLANRVFAILSVVLALWLSCQYFGSIATSEVWLEFWVRQACATSVFIPLFFHLLRCAAINPQTALIRLLLDSKAWLLSTIAMSVLAQTRFFLVAAHLATGDNMIAEPHYGPGLPLFTLYWCIAVSRLIWCFFKSLGHAEGVFRMEIQVIAYGSLFALVPGLVLVAIIPFLSGSSQSARFAPIAVVTWHSTIAYGIATRHIMGVGEFFQRIVVWGLAILFLAGLYLVVFLLIQRLPFAGSTAMLHTTAHGIAAIATTLCFSPAQNFLRNRAERLFEHDHQEIDLLVHEGGELARSITTVDSLFTEFDRLLRESLGVSWMRVYLREGTRFVPSEHNGVEAPSGQDPISADSPLVLALSQTRRPLLRDVLRRANGTPLELVAERTLASLDAEAAVALHAKNGMTGFLLLGRRRKGQFYGKREESALLFLGQEMGFAIENATLYTHLQEARLYNEVLLENLVTGVVATDRDGRVTVCNREAQRILGVPEGAPVAGRPASELLPQPIWTELHASFVSGRAMRDRDLVLHPQTAQEQSLRFATAVFGGDGRGATGAILVLQDTSAIRRLEEQVRRSDRLASIGTLAAGMAHEIKNPLVCLKTFVQLLPTQFDNPEFRDSFAPLLGKEVERINSIVSQLLNFSRPVKPELAPISIHSVLDAAWQLAVQQVKAKGMVFDRHFQAGDDHLLGDARLLGQVFLNLFLNSIDAMGQGGTLTVSTHPLPTPDLPWRKDVPAASDWIEVRVSDTGQGIPPEDLKHVFDPFFTTKANGTGLGLSVALGIIQEHHGHMDVTSTPHNGTCFRVLLPLLSPAGGDAPREAKGTT